MSFHITKWFSRTIKKFDMTVAVSFGMCLLIIAGLTLFALDALVFYNYAWIPLRGQTPAANQDRVIKVDQDKVSRAEDLIQNLQDTVYKTADNSKIPPNPF